MPLSSALFQTTGQRALRWGLVVGASVLLSCALSLAAFAASAPASTPRVGVAVQVPTAIGTAYDGYLAGPVDGAAAVLLLHDRFGLDTYTLDLADRFAKLGYRVLAPDLFDGRRNPNAAEATYMVRAIDPSWNETNVRAGLAYLRAPGRKIAVVGYGYGGEVAMTAPVIAPQDVAAVVNYYGQVPRDIRGVQPLQAPVMGIFARADTRIPAERIDAFEDAMRQLKRGVSIQRIDADYGFAHPGYRGFNEGAEQTAWRQASTFLAEMLPAGSLSPPVPEEVPAEPAAVPADAP